MSHDRSDLLISSRRRVLFVLTALSLVVPPVSAQRPIEPVRPPGVEDFLAIHSPAATAWSSDGQRLAYQLMNINGGEIRVYDRTTKRSVTVVRGLPPQRFMKDHPDLRWSIDGTRLLYRSATRYFSLPAAGGTPQALLDSARRELVQLSPDQRSASFVRAGELWVEPLNGGAARQLTTGERLLTQDGQLFSRLAQDPLWSPDGKKIAYLSATERGFRPAVLDVEQGRVTPLVPNEGDWQFDVLSWSPDSRRIAIARMNGTFQRKELLVADVAAGTTASPLWVDTDERWVEHNIRATYLQVWSPDGKQIAFVSNRSGWHQVYIAPADGRSEAKRITDGSFDVEGLDWLPDGSGLVATTNEGALQERHVWVIPASGGRRTKLSSGVGMTTDFRNLGGWALPAISPDGKYVAYPFSTPDDPYQLLVVARRVSAPVLVYSVVAEGFDPRAVPRMEAVRFASADGTMIPAVLITARDLDRNVRHPAVVHMYGGWRQMATLGRGSKSPLLDYLASRGYVILVVDPRGSEGYGEEYSKGLYHDAAGKQSDDLIAAAGYLRAQPYIDPRGIALFGHSYGAFLTLATLEKDPAAFNGGILLAGVYDFKTFASGGGTYSNIRFGAPSDAQNLIAARGVPVEHLDRLTVPVFVVQGMADFNVPPLFAEQLVTALLRNDKRFEYMAYPGETHSWQFPETYRDYLRRVEAFLGRTFPPAQHSSPEVKR